MSRKLVALAIVLAAAAVVDAADHQLADPPRRRQALEMYRAGQELMSRERFDEAAEAFRKSIERDPLLSVAHYQLGQAYMNLRRFTSATLAYQGAIEAMRTLHGLEQASRFEVDKQREEEIRELRVEMSQALASSPLKRVVLEQRVHDLEKQSRSMGGPFRAPAFVLLALGSAHFRNGELEVAEAEWKAALEADPKYGEAHNNLAVVYMMNGRLQDAEAEIKLADKYGFRMNPQFKEDLKERRNATRTK
jgi:Flp pilus assembly protein TadD